MSEFLESTAIDHWRRDPVRFIAEVLRDPETLAPFDLLEAERRFISYAFQTDDDGRLIYPEQMYAAPKKSGKTGFGAIQTLTTTLVFGGAFAEGYCVANDLEQAQGRVFQAIRRIVEASPHLKRAARVTQSRIDFPETGASIAAIASDYAVPRAEIQLSPFSTNFGATLASAAIACGMSWCHRRHAKSRSGSSLLSWSLNV